jgi:hypothetical protein
LRSHKKSSREETISSDTDRLKICATTEWFMESVERGGVAKKRAEKKIVKKVPKLPNT